MYLVDSHTHQHKLNLLIKVRFGSSKGQMMVRWRLGVGQNLKSFRSLKLVGGLKTCIMNKVTLYLASLWPLSVLTSSLACTLDGLRAGLESNELSGSLGLRIKTKTTCHQRSHLMTGADGWIWTSFRRRSCASLSLQVDLFLLKQEFLLNIQSSIHQLRW